MASTLVHLGRVADMAAADYFAVDAMSNSGLKRLQRSPWHYRSGFLPAAPGGKEATPAMFAGTLAHCALLEPAEFDKRYVVGPDYARSNKIWKDFVAEHPDQDVITMAQKGVAFAQAEALRGAPEVRKLFAYPGEEEVSIFWRDEKTGVLCKARPDRVCRVEQEGVILFDAKTTGDASPEGFRKAVGNFRYHQQAAFYARGWEAATGETVLGMVFGAVESEYPFATCTYMLADPILDYAQREIDRLLAIYAQCLQTGVWPGYPVELQLIESLPPWTMTA
jgi:hypothetical protein